ncbi:MAG: tetratricopeptide repeat protein [Bacteroidetes bacterium]|nr:tetratricopeptide repeat protein [Bacteroidota bacterium]
MTSLKQIILATALFCIHFITAVGQPTAIQTSPEAAYEEGVARYKRGAYDLALPLLEKTFRQWDAEEKFPNSAAQREGAFYLYDCLLKLQREQVIQSAQTFIEREDPVLLKNKLSFQLADYYFRKNDFKNSMEYDARAGAEGLSKEQRNQVAFRRAYALFHFNRYAEAKPLFELLAKQPLDAYFEKANYYYGYLCFLEKDFATALTSFRLIESALLYKDVVPFYLASIYLSENALDSALAIGEKALERTTVSFRPEIARMVGHIHYDRRNYSKAALYLGQYVSANSKVGRDVFFELHDSYYRLKQYEKAAVGLKELSAGTDKLSRIALYMLADVYLQTGDKVAARNAFSMSAADSTDAVQQEVALFLFAKLSAELQFYGEAIAAIEQFNLRYPQSSYRKEAIELMVSLLAATSNYKDALVLLESLEKPSDATRQIIPVIRFGRAMQWLNDQQDQEAEKLLDQVINDPKSGSALPTAHYWKGEIAYRKGDIKQAKEYFLLFLRSGSKGQGEANIITAYYNLGYCYLKEANYAAALEQFQKAAPQVNKQAGKMEQDAAIRQADCYFMQKKYSTAKSLYQQSIDFKWQNADYATFQQALILGISSTKAKIELLKSMESSYPTSALLPEAIMQIAMSLMSDEKFREAIPYLNAVARQDTTHPFHIEASLQLGIAWYNLDEQEKALAQFSAVVKKAPYSEAAVEALENIRAICLESGNAEMYETQMRALGREVSRSEADSLAYASIQLKLSAGDCKSAVKLCDQYLSRFAGSSKEVEVLYQKSECLMVGNNKSELLPVYELICTKGSNPYIEKAARWVARYYFFDLKDFAKAQPYYELLQQYAATDEAKLESYRGNLRCLYQLKNIEKGVLVARELLLQKQAATDDQALSYLMIGKSEQANKIFDKALVAFRQVLSRNKGEWAAEAGYEMAACQFALGDLSAAEQMAFEVIKKSGSYAFWVTKSYLLLGDIFYTQKDYFNAKATYQSIAENARDNSLKEEGARKLLQVKEEEAKAGKTNNQ